MQPCHFTVIGFFVYSGFMNSRQRELKRQKIKRARQISKTNTLIKSIESTVTINSSDMDSMFFTPCIYFLLQNDKVVYVGESISVMTRISQHVKDGTKSFNGFSFEPFRGSDKERKHKEKLLIKKLQPVYNIQHAVVRVLKQTEYKGCSPDLIPDLTS